jgi:hypothetical protein
MRIVRERGTKIGREGELPHVSRRKHDFGVEFSRFSLDSE